MTARERRLLASFNRRAASQTPEMIRAILAAWEAVKAQIPPGELADALKTGLAELLLTDALLDSAFMPVRVQLRLQVQNNVSWAAKDLPRRGRIDGKLAVHFNVLNERHIDAVRALDTRVMRVLRPAIRDTVREVIEAGLRIGANPRETARHIRDLVGVAPQHANAVLEGRMTLKRALSWHASTISRTATLDALKVGNQLSWREAIANGFVPADRVRKRWLAIVDDRTRDEHVEMNGETVPFESPYRNGDTYAGEGSPWNCRCRDVIFVALPSRTSAQPGIIGV